MPLGSAFRIGHLQHLALLGLQLLHSLLQVQPLLQGLVIIPLFTDHIRQRRTGFIRKQGRIQ
ncbi:hypothetical protein D3C76_1779400 [compost metagenome]